VTTPEGGLPDRHGFPRYLNIRHLWWKTAGAEAKDADSQEGKTLNLWCNPYDTRFCAVFQLFKTLAALELCTLGFISRDGALFPQLYTDASGKEQVRLSAYRGKAQDTATNKDGGPSWWTVWYAEGGSRAGWTPTELELAFQTVLNHSGLGMWSVGGKTPGFCSPHSIRASAVAWAGRCGSAMAGSVQAMLQAMLAGGWAGLDSQFLVYYKAGSRQRRMFASTFDGTDPWLLKKPWPLSGMTFDEASPDTSFKNGSRSSMVFNSFSGMRS